MEPSRRGKCWEGPLGHLKTSRIFSMQQLSAPPECRVLWLLVKTFQLASCPGVWVLVVSRGKRPSLLFRG